MKKAYKDYEKILRRAISCCKNAYEEKIISGFGFDGRKIWSFINKKLNRKIKTTHIDQVVVDKEVFDDPSDIADKFNNFFTEIGLKLDKEMPPSDGEQQPLKSDPCSFSLEPTKAIEIEGIIDNLPNKAGGWDNVSARALKCVSTVISNSLELIFNSCIETGIWPDCLKSADIVPIYKDENRQLLTNYRPIALISNFAKILEKIVHIRLYAFLQKKTFFSENQFGFLKDRSTKNALELFTHFVYKYINDNKKVIATFVDLKKAFDTVNYGILLDKLSKCGIRGTPHALLRNYLYGRKCRTRVNGIESSSSGVNIGVPQGTILGPLLFLIYMNDIENSCILYADDTVVLSVSNTWRGAERKMNELLAKIDKWFIQNRLTLNLEKTVYMALGVYKDSTPSALNVSIRNQSITRVTTCKYLGVQIDCNLRWEDHINLIVKKTKYLIFIFRKLSKRMSKHNLGTIYFALFQSIATYGIIAWGGAYDNVLKKLQTVQNRLTKFLPNFSFSTIEQMYILESILYHFKHLQTKYLNKTLITRTNQLPLPEIHKEFYKKSSKYIATKAFNSLPVEIKNKQVGHKLLRTQLKKWIFQSSDSAKFWNVCIKRKK